MNSVSRNCGAFFAYCFAYLILPQKYVCSGGGGGGIALGDGLSREEFSQCSVEDICAARRSGAPLDFTYKVDTSYEYYLSNWYVEMDLMCTPLTQISLMFMWFFIGTIAGGSLAVIPDRIGRKKTVIWGMTVSLAAQTVMIFSPDILIRSICFFVLGISNLKNSVSYVWASESVPFKRRSTVFTIINVVDAMPTLITGGFYLLVAREWFTIYAINVAVGYSALLLALVCPESPRWLLYNGRQKEAIDALNYMARFNQFGKSSGGADGEAS